ncbi:helix-turn-helix domain-containing protein [Alicyclobacillus sp.]|uniref:helix-turn-helix domain-containing protein n=1 Tax=Alicyclobacillus sp. TaxID=61169 RepID=UPI0025C4A315|nr:helix-turn-helix domain-containing protein [Alicyclobacillus sp.]MCL6517094.1 helix-turn-helix domain-containing protein [Alicyclobacillus sp.]
MRDQRHSDPGDEVKAVRHQVRRGRVMCPRRGLIDVDVCFYCSYLHQVDLDHKPGPYISCTSPPPATEAERVAYERLGILELAEALGNVSEACRERGISRKWFYQLKHRFEQEGLQGLAGRSRGRKKLNG